MGGKVTPAAFPLERGLWASIAVPSRSKLGGAATSVAFFDDWVAGTAIKGTTFLSHKHAFRARLYRCTVHGNHPLSLLLYDSLLETRKKRLNISLLDCCQQYFWALDHSCRSNALGGLLWPLMVDGQSTWNDFCISLHMLDSPSYLRKGPSPRTRVVKSSSFWQKDMEIVRKTCNRVVSFMPSW